MVTTMSHTTAISTTETAGEAAPAPLDPAASATAQTSGAKTTRPAAEDIDDGTSHKKQRISPPTTSRLQMLKTGVESEAPSPSSSRQSTPSVHAAEGAGHVGVGGAKRKRDERKTLPRNIDKVYYGDFEIKTWYHSPYPLEDDHHATANGVTHGHGVAHPASKKKGGRASTSTASTSGNNTVAPSPSPAPDTPRSVPQPKVPGLWICDGCFKYMRTYAGWNAHRRECTHKHPPGRKVYQRGAHTIWEVDGSKEKLYAQNLCLFGKLFIDHKTIFFDVEPFLFYVVTDATVNFDFTLGYFSKEKVSYDDYNLACIITFPPYQKKGYGTLMIEFSYYLSSRAGTLGTPERPLSELGFKGYVAYWSAVVLRTLALAFNEDDADVMSRLLPQAGPSPSKAPLSSTVSRTVSRFQKKAAVRIRSLLLGVEDPTELQAQNAEGVNEAQLTHDERQELRRLRRSAVGWAGELPPALAAKLASFGSSPTKVGTVKEEGEAGGIKSTLGHTQISLVKEEEKDEQGASLSGSDTREGPDRAARRSTTPKITASKSPAQTRPAPTSTQSAALDLDRSTPLTLCTTLDRISQATGLRHEDASFALSECGLLKWRMSGVPDGAASSSDASTTGEGPYILLTREAVRDAVVRRNLKRPVLDLQYVFC